MGNFLIQLIQCHLSLGFPEDKLQFLQIVEYLSFLKPIEDTGLFEPERITLTLSSTQDKGSHSQISNKGPMPMQCMLLVICHPRHSFKQQLVPKYMMPT